MVLDWISCFNFYELCLVNIIRSLIIFTEVDIIQHNDLNISALNTSLPQYEYLNRTGPVSCHYWRASLGK